MNIFHPPLRFDRTHTWGAGKLVGIELQVGHTLSLALSNALMLQYVWTHAFFQLNWSVALTNNFYFYIFKLFDLFCFIFDRTAGFCLCN